MAALAAWRAMLGDDAVAADATQLGRNARTTQPTGAPPWCALHPSSTAQVQAIVRIAAEHGTPLYPISRGCNWGYGDACPPQAGAALLDLSRMNRILALNVELGWVRIEPGVTQQQLCDYIAQHAPGYWVDVTGAGPDASLVGNIVERGFGHTPYADHLGTACALEIVLADGTVLETGLAHFPGARAAGVYPYGTGPVLDGLFSQSNLGIVTAATVWLYPKPEAFRFFYLKVDADEALCALVEALRPLRLQGVLNSAVHLGNDLRVISGNRTYPWAEAEGKTPLPEDLRAALRRESGVGAWSVSGALVGGRAQVREAAGKLRAAVKGLGTLTFVDDRRLVWGSRLVTLLERVGLGAHLRRQLDALAPNYGLLQGRPATWALRGTHWRLRNPPADPACDPRDCGAGLLWVSPVLPVRGADAVALKTLVEPILAAHGFELIMTYTLLNERAMVAVINISFDKGVPEETEAAAGCYHALMAACVAAGFPPYRTSPGGMAHLRVPEDTFWTTASRIKQALDPQGILSPGRYIP
jgi:4-cresol dehydrogenase (hydroxylating)